MYSYDSIEPPFQPCALELRAPRPDTAHPLRAVSHGPDQPCSAKRHAGGNRPGSLRAVARGDADARGPAVSDAAARTQPARCGSRAQGGRGSGSAALFVAALFAAPVAAQSGERFLVSTSDAATAQTGPLGAFGDEALVVVRPGEDPQPWLLERNWLALSALVPTDIDALALVPGKAGLFHGSICFSLISDQAGFKDGDVIAFGANGAPFVYIPETTLALGLGISGNGLDLDGIAFDGSGRLLFTLQNDVMSPVLGDILNGDILRLEPNGTATRVLSEADVQAAYTAATGSGAAIGDVQGLEWHAGEIWVTVQSPSSADGGVLRVSPNPGFVATEGELGLGGAEIDGLARLPQSWSAINEPFSLWIEPAGVGTGHVGQLSGGTPGGVALALASATPGFYVDGFLGGYGTWQLNPFDSALLGLMTGPGAAVLLLDGDGQLVHPIAPPLVGAGIGHTGNTGWSFQVIDVSTFRLSPPCRLEF